MSQSMAPVGFMSRLRVKAGKALTSDETSLQFVFAGRQVTLKAEERDQALRESKWLVFTAEGFESEAEAQSFGEELRSAVQLTGVCTLLGIDGGDDRTSVWVDEEFARSLGLIEKDERVAPNIHGVSVYPADGRTRFPVSNPTLVVTADPTQLLGALEELGPQVPLALGGSSTGVRLMNFAIMDPQPLSRLVLALSAVEALGQEEKWTEQQREMIEQLAVQTEQAADDPETLEVVDALRKSLFRLSVRQGVKRVLVRLGLADYQKEWDRLYGLRSGIFHGTSLLSDAEINKLANETISLCGRIILRLVETEGVKLPSVTERHFPAPS